MSDEDLAVSSCVLVARHPGTRDEDAVETTAPIRERRHAASISRRI